MDETGSGDGREMDPINTAAAVSKVAGAAAGTANSVAKNSLVHNLLGPITKAYGDHWGEQARANLKAGLKEAAEAKKAENLSAHARSVRDCMGDDFEPDPALSEEWVVGAESIDPQDAELAAAWRGVLLAIGNGDIQRRRLLDAVQALSPEEAHAFMAIYSKRGTYSESIAPYRTRLQSCGLLVPPLEVITSRRNMTVYLMLICLILALMSTNYFPYSIVKGEEVNLGIQNRFFVAFVALLGVIVLLMFVFRAFYTLRLTRLGLTLGKFSARAMAVEVESAETANEFVAASDRPKRKSPSKAKVDD